MRVITIFVLLWICIPGGTSSCVQELETNEEFTMCNNEYLTYLANAGSSIAAGAGNQMVQIMCRPEGKAAMGCMQPFYDRCPQMAATPQHSIFHQIKDLGGVDVLCRKVEGPCPGIERCITGTSLGQSGSFTEKTDFFDKMPDLLQLLCGPLANKVSCLNGHEQTCPKLEQLVEHIPEELRPLDLTWPKYSVLKEIVLQGCTATQDFVNNMCIRNVTAGTDFRKCYDDKNLQCSIYEKIFACLSHVVGEACGFPLQVDVNCQQTTDGTGKSSAEHSRVDSNSEDYEGDTATDSNGTSNQKIQGNQKESRLTDEVAHSAANTLPLSVFVTLLISFVINSLLE